MHCSRTGYGYRLSETRLKCLMSWCQCLATVTKKLKWQLCLLLRLQNRFFFFFFLWGDSVLLLKLLGKNTYLLKIILVSVWEELAIETYWSCLHILHLFWWLMEDLTTHWMSIILLRKVVMRAPEREEVRNLGLCIHLRKEMARSSSKLCRTVWAFALFLAVQEHLPRLFMVTECATGNGLQGVSEERPMDSQKCNTGSS